MAPRGALAALAVLSVAALQAAAQPFQSGTGFVPLGNLRTTDSAGPHNLTLLPIQAQEIQAAVAGRNFTDKDIIDFLVNVECLEGLFDTWGTFGRGFLGNLEQGGPPPIGAQKANIVSPRTLAFLQEVALNEQGHTLFTRHAGSSLPCPQVDFLEGFNGFMAFAYDIPVPAGSTAVAAVEAKYGVSFNPFQDDATFTLCVLSLEELGATGNKGLTGLISNPVLANAVAGLATSATAQAAVERTLLWDYKEEIIAPFGETAQQVFARISALRDFFDGPQLDDQGLVNTDARFIAQPTFFVNNIPTDIQGITFNRSPAQLINILTLGNVLGIGNFFPNGLNGNIKTPAGYNLTATGLDNFPFYSDPALIDFQESAAQVGTIAPPITGPTPTSVPGQADLLQADNGPLTDATYLTRGYVPFAGPVTTYGDPAPAVDIGTPSGTLVVPKAACPQIPVPSSGDVLHPFGYPFPNLTTIFSP